MAETPVPAGQPHKGWYSRGYLPHLDQPGLVQGITFRLHDSMLVERREEWESLLAVADVGERLLRIEEYLNAGYGSCVLRDHRVGLLVQDALQHLDGQRYRLLAWVVMPNHVHVLIETLQGWSLPGIVHSWKSFTAHQVNRLLGRKGPLWSREFFDRAVRDGRHLKRAVRYVHDNPVKAGLVAEPEVWPFSSARWLVDGGDAGVDGELG